MDAKGDDAQQPTKRDVMLAQLEDALQGAKDRVGASAAESSAAEALGAGNEGGGGSSGDHADGVSARTSGGKNGHAGTDIRQAVESAERRERDELEHADHESSEPFQQLLDRVGAQSTMQQRAAEQEQAVLAPVEAADASGAEAGDGAAMESEQL